MFREAALVVGSVIVMIAGCGHSPPGPQVAPDGQAAPDASVTACSVPDPHEVFLKPSNPGAQFLFGWNVAISADGNTLAVGAEEEPSGSTGINGNQNDSSAPGAGAVYVFIRSGGAWSQQAYIKASNARTNSFFGASVAISADGNTLAVGAPLESSSATGIDGDQSDTSAAAAGAVYVFTRSGQQWAQQAYVKSSNTKANARFAVVSIAGDGNTLAVSDETALYVFTRSQATWTQQTMLTPTGAGQALSADGNTLVVSAAIAFRVFTRAAGVWGPPLEISSPVDPVTGAATSFGDVALSADASTLAISAWHAPNTDAADIYTRSGSSWTEAASLHASRASADALFGRGLALSADGKKLTVGAPGDASAATGIDGDQADSSAPRSGAVYLFANAGTWMQTHYIKASNSAANDWFGGDSVAISGDGTTVAAGAPNDPSAATGVGGDQCDRSAPERGAAFVIQP